MEVIQLFLVSFLLFTDHVVIGTLTLNLSAVNNTSIPLSTDSKAAPLNGNKTTNRLQLPNHFPTNCSNKYRGLSLKSSSSATESHKIQYSKSNNSHDDTMMTPENNIVEIVMSLAISVLQFFLYKIDTWLNSESQEPVRKYFGLSNEAKNLVDDSMTQLLYQKRRFRTLSVPVGEVENLFYVICDLDHAKIHGGYDERHVYEEYVTLVYTKFLRTHSMILKESDYDEVKLEKALKRFLSCADDKAPYSFEITIESMKNRPLIDPSENEDVNKLKERYIGELNISVQDFAKNCENETDGEKIMENYNRLHQIVVSDLFGFVLNHFNLVDLLKQSDINKDDQKVIDTFQPFMVTFVRDFMERHNEFSHNIDPDLLNALYVIHDYLDPQSSTNPEKVIHYVQNLYNKNKILLKSAFGFPNAERVQELKTIMQDLVNNATNMLLSSCGESRENWERERASKICIPENPAPNKQELLKMIQENTSRASKMVEELLIKSGRKYESDNKRVDE